MVASLDWSHALLSEAEQKVFRRLAIFPGGFTFRAAGAVAADEIHGESEILDLVAALVAKSLVAVDARATEPRFRLLETTRAYALAKLAKSGDINMIPRRHAEYFDPESEIALKRQPAIDDCQGPSLRISTQQTGSIKQHFRTSGTMMALLR